MLLFAAGAGVGSTLATDSAGTPTAVRVVARDYSYVLSRLTVPVGRVRFTVVNRGSVAHDFSIAGRRTPLLKPGTSAVLTVTVSRAGRVAYRCTVPGHAALGMKGTMTVGRGCRAGGERADHDPDTADDDERDRRGKADQDRRLPAAGVRHRAARRP
jgi:plastocyanin